MNNKNIIFLVFFFLFTSCGSEDCLNAKWESLPVFVNATEETQITAINAINDAFDFTIFDIDPAGIQIVMTANFHSNGPVKVRGEAKIKCSNGVIYDAQLKIDSRLSESRTTKIIAHELGHTLGIDHQSEGIMLPNSGFDQELFDLVNNQVFFESVVEKYNL